MSIVCVSVRLIHYRIKINFKRNDHKVNDIFYWSKLIHVNLEF